MYLKILLSILCLFLTLGFCVGSDTQCGGSRFSTQYFTPNGTYDTNRRVVLSNLASNVSSRGGYYNVSFGEAPGRIYALGMCIPGVEPKRCSDCIQQVADNLLQNCKNQTSSFEWASGNNLCFVSYSDVLIFDSLNQAPMQTRCNNENIANVTEFNRVWAGFMEDMILTASSSHYAAKVSQPMGFQNIYALMQCIPGLSSLDCGVCLRRSVSTYEERCKGMQGSQIRRPVCFFRWETFPNYDAFVQQMSPPPLNPQGSQPMPHATKKNTISRGTLNAIVIVAAIISALLAIGFVYFRRRKTTKLKIDDNVTSPQSLQFDFKTLEAATNNFSGDNKIGEGGFGEVYKGTFLNGTEIAVKRLSRTSGQGLKEFQNEVVVVAKLHHRNLVRILGFCLEGEEQILVYEFVPNKSLDYFLFDLEKQVLLDWTRRYNIIVGIARGILYLHHDSRITIIHRNLKASNILLDEDMKPRIADFGTARIFGLEQTRANTSKIAGTYGYMAPEYAMHGQISVKSDVYSFGVLILEIISGKMNSSFYQTDGSAGNLVTHAWRLWRKGLALQLLDPTFGENYQSDEIVRCIHIALLCSRGS